MMGFARQQVKNRLQSIISRMIGWRYFPVENPTFDQLCRKADPGLFTAVLNNPGHVLHKLLPPRKSTTYALRPWSHDRVLTLIDNNNYEENICRKNAVLLLIFVFVL